MCIKEGDEWKAAFHTNRGLFKPLVMFFGLTNSPATFQMMMNDIFQDLIMQGVVCVYINNILIYTHTHKEHCHIMCIVMEWLCEHKLYLHLDKCKFECTCSEYLGLIILEGKVEMDPVKVAGVTEWPWAILRDGFSPMRGFPPGTCQAPIVLQPTVGTPCMIWFLHLV